MSNEIKRRVLLASVLKPVDDTRMLEKIGATLAEAGVAVTITGYPAATEVHTPGISLEPLPRFSRISLKRLLIPWIIFGKINRINPDTIIINTPELLIIGVLSRLLFGRKVVYDILENYDRTIRFTNTYPKLIRLPLAGLVRLTEVICAPFVHRFLLAEKGYVSELPFVKEPVILENKLPHKIAIQYRSDEQRQRFNLLFSGTLAPTTGVFDAIRLAGELHRVNPAYTLTIIGFAAMRETRDRIKQELVNRPFIRLIGGDRLVAHRDILQAILSSGTGIVIYPNNPGTESSIPTKVYEYLALRLPMVIAHTPETCRLVTACGAGIVLEPRFLGVDIHQKLTNATFTFDCDESVYWESQAQTLLTAVSLP